MREAREVKLTRRSVRSGLGRGAKGAKAEELLSRCATHPDPRVRQEGARASWREDVVKALSEDPVVDVRAAAAKNPLLPKEDQERLAEEGRAEVAEALASNPNLHPSAIEAFFLKGIARLPKGVGALRSFLAMAKRVPEGDFSRLVLLNPKVPGWMRVELLSTEHGHRVPTPALIGYLCDLSLLERPEEAKAFRRAYIRLAERRGKERVGVLLEKWNLFSRLASGGEILEVLGLAYPRIPTPLLEAIARDAPGVLGTFLERIQEIPPSWAKVLIRYPTLSRFAVRKVRQVPIKVQEELVRRREWTLLWELAATGRLDKGVAVKLLLGEFRDRCPSMAHDILRWYGLPSEGAEELIGALLSGGLRSGDRLWLLAVLEKSPLPALAGLPKELLAKVAKELSSALHTLPPSERVRAERLLANELFAQNLGVAVEVFGL